MRTAIPLGVLAGLAVMMAAIPAAAAAPSFDGPWQKAWNRADADLMRATGTHVVVREGTDLVLLEGSGLDEAWRAGGASVVPFGIACGHVVAGDGDHLEVRDIADGTVLWQRARPTTDMELGPWISGGRIFWTLAAGEIRSERLADGAAEPPIARDATSFLTVTPVDGTVFVPSAPNRLFAVLPDGHEAWETTLANRAAVAFADREFVVHGGSTRTLEAFEAATGNPAWTLDAPDQPAMGTLAGGQLLLLGGNRVSSVAVADGTLMWSLALEPWAPFVPGHELPPAPPAIGAPVLDEAYAYVADYVGHVLVLDRDSGHQVQALDVGKPVERIERVGPWLLAASDAGLAAYRMEAAPGTLATENDCGTPDGGRQGEKAPMPWAAAPLAMAALAFLMRRGRGQVPAGPRS